MAQPAFIFTGTVQRTRAATVPELKLDSRTLVVRVDEVVAAPPTLARTAGRDVTVILGPADKAPKPGEQAVFSAASGSFGEEIAVHATIGPPPPVAGGGIGAARAAAAPLSAGAVIDPVQAHRDLLLKRSLDQADVVIAGTVMQVRVAPETEAGMKRSPGLLAARTAGTTAPPLGRISEHDAIWHEAVVNVESVEKGSTADRQVVVRFPKSNDVRWRYYPKLRAGQQGVFLLNADAPATAGAAKAARTVAGRAARLMTVAPVPALQNPTLQTAGEPQPISAIEKVRQLLGGLPHAAIVHTHVRTTAGGRSKAAGGGRGTKKSATPTVYRPDRDEHLHARAAAARKSGRAAARAKKGSTSSGRRRASTRASMGRGSRGRK
jgi:hypothetical protein